MNDTPIEVIGSGFVPGIPGIFANTVIPAPQAEPAPDLPDNSAQPSPEPSPPSKSSPSKSSSQAKDNQE